MTNVRIAVKLNQGQYYKTIISYGALGELYNIFSVILRRDF